jgi:hypothetical protein
MINLNDLNDHRPDAEIAATRRSTMQGPRGPRAARRSDAVVAEAVDDVARLPTALLREVYIPVTFACFHRRADLAAVRLSVTKVAERGSLRDGGFAVPTPVPAPVETRENYFQC